MNGVKYIAPFRDHSGYGEASRNYILSLAKKRIPITIHPQCFEPMPPPVSNEEDRALLEDLTELDIPYDVVITHLTPDLYPRFAEDDKYNIGFTAWETTLLHPKWIQCCNTMDEMWVPSEMNVKALRNSGVTVPITKIPHGIDTDMFSSPAADFSIGGINESTFKFYSVFQWITRKNPEGLLRAYFNAFKEEDNVALIIKSYMMGSSSKEKGFIKDKILWLKRDFGISNYPKVYFVSDLLSKEQLLGLHNYGDCLVSLHKGEGWGLCVHPETAVQCINGSVKIKDLAIGERVLSEDGAFHKVLAKTSRTTNYLYRVRVGKNKTSVLVTEEHPFLVSKSSRWQRSERSNNIKLEWLPVTSLDSGDLVAVPRPNLGGILPSKIDLLSFVKEDPNIIYDDKFVWHKFGFSGLNTEFSYKTLCKKLGETKKVIENARKFLDGKKEKTSGRAKAVADKLISMGYFKRDTGIIKVNRFMDIDEGFLWMLGWYIAEGCADGSEVDFCLGADDSPYIYKLCGVLKRFGVKVSKKFTGKGIRIRLNSKILVSFFTKMCGKRAENKKIPFNVFSSGAKLVPLLEGIFLGDGHWGQNRSPSICTVSDTLTNQIKCLLLGYGVFPSVSRQHRKHGNFPLNVITFGGYAGKRFIIDNFWYKKIEGAYLECLLEKRQSNGYFLYKNFFLIPIKDICVEEYAGLVYDINVEGVHSFVGNDILLHNTCFESGLSGNPVIATGWGGNTDFMNEENSYLTKYQMSYVAGMGGFNPWYLGYQQWAEPDLVHAAGLMRYVFEHRELAKEKGKKLQEDIKNNFSWDKVADLIVKRLGEI